MFCHADYHDHRVSMYLCTHYKHSLLMNLLCVLHSPSSILCQDDQNKWPLVDIDVGIITSKKVSSRHNPVPHHGQLPFNGSTPIWSPIFIVLKISGIAVMYNSTQNMPELHLIFM